MRDCALNPGFNGVFSYLAILRRQDPTMFNSGGTFRHPGGSLSSLEVRGIAIPVVKGMDGGPQMGNPKNIVGIELVFKDPGR